MSVSRRLMSNVWRVRCPGDEIRPVVRTMVRDVQKCIVFLSKEYASSPNCCVEFWEAMQCTRPYNGPVVVRARTSRVLEWLPLVLFFLSRADPKKVIVCLLDEAPEGVLSYLHDMGSRVCNGIDKYGDRCVLFKLHLFLSRTLARTLLFCIRFLFLAVFVPLSPPPPPPLGHTHAHCLLRF